MITIVCLAAALFLQAQNVTVSGRVVVDEAMRARVIRVALSSAAGGEARTTIIESDGSFDFANVTPGTYTVLAYASTSVSSAQTISVGAADVANLTIPLPQPKAVHGRISVLGKPPRNTPMPRLAFSLAPLPGISNSGASVASNAQPDGSFNVDLPEGERQVSIAAGTIPPGYKIQSFIYGATDLLKNPLRVTTQDSAELRVVLDASSITAFKVSGRVTDLLTTTGVRVVLAHPVFGSVEAPVSPDGSFVFPDVFPGNYVARLSVSGLTAGRQVTVADHDLTDVVITYPREFIVGGHIVVEGDAGATPSITVEARDSKRGGDPWTALSVNNVTMLRVKDGEYNVSLRNVPAGYQLKSITYGPTDLQKAPLKIDGPATWEIIVRLIPSPR